MRYRTLVTLGALAGMAAVPLAGLGAQQAAPVKPHTIEIRLIEQPGAIPFAFEPATFAAERGDTLRFVQAAATMHNVHFKTVPAGAHLGSALSGPYLTTKGQTYIVVVDKRFVDGKYELVCDPHEMIGMHATLTVAGTAGQ